MWDLIFKGGPLMSAILLCSIFALAVFIERWFYFKKAKVNVDDFMSQIRDNLKRNKILEAITLCDNLSSPLSSVLKAGILKYDCPRDEIKEAIDDASLHEVPKLERNLGIIATIAHIAPLLGLLGTVQGMIQSFRVIEEKAFSGVGANPSDLAGGIWVSLLTTAAGLVVAIPAYVAHNYLVSRVNDFVTEMEQSATSLVNILITRGEEHEV